MTRRKTSTMEHSQSGRPKDGRCAVGIVAQGPEDRGDLGRIQMRDPETSRLRYAWVLRCPWCRELIEIASERIFVSAGEPTIKGGAVDCPNCSQGTVIRSGVGTHSNGVG